MASLPRATTTLSESGGGLSVEKDLLCVLAPAGSGVDATLRYYASVQDIADEFGEGEGLEFAARFVEDTGLGIMFGKLPTASAAAIGPVDVKGVTGTSAVTFSGTPVDDEELRVEVVAGGTIGTAGITIRTSRDGGRTFGPSIRLGTATSYAIPRTGVTVNFAAGTLATDDVATANCTSARGDAAGLATLFDAVAASNRMPRAFLIVGDVDGTMLDAVISEIGAYETADHRHARIFCNLRDQYRPARAQGTFTVTTAQVGKTYTRSAGSFITDGFHVGMTATWAGFVNSASNGTKTIATLTATVMTVTEAIGADEAAVASTTATAVESKATWRSALGLITSGATPPAAKSSHRTCVRGGRARNRSAIDQRSFKRRPAVWAELVATFKHDIHISAAKVENEGLPGWSIVDANGVLVEHDERVDGGLLADRIGGLRTHDGEAGVFVSLPLTLDTDGAPMSRVPVGFVADVVATVSNREWARKLNREVNLRADGKPSEAECVRLEGLVTEELRSVLLSPGAEGPRISTDESAGPTIGTTMPRDVDLSTPGTEVPVETFFVPVGYLEKITNTVRVRTGGK